MNITAIERVRNRNINFFGSGDISLGATKISSPHLRTIETIFRPSGPWFGLNSPGMPRDISSIRSDLKQLNNEINIFKEKNPSLFFEGFVPTTQQRYFIDKCFDDIGFSHAFSIYKRNLSRRGYLSTELRQMQASKTLVEESSIVKLFDFLEVHEAAYAVLAENDFEFYFDFWGSLRIKNTSTYNRLGHDKTKFEYLNNYLKYIYENFKADLLLIHDNYFEIEDLVEQRKVEKEYSRYLSCIIDRGWLRQEYNNWCHSFFNSYDDIDQDKNLGSYKIKKKLVGKGGMGLVAIAENKDGKKVVIKIPSRETLTDLQVQGEKRLIREGRICYGFVSPNNVKLLDMDSIFIKDRYVPVLVFEYAEGDSLDDFLEARISPLVKKLTPHEVIYIILKVCLGLIEAHNSQIIHKDFKKGNIIINVKENDGQGLILEADIKNIDFGIASVKSQKTFTSGLFPIGTPNNSPPEQHIPGTKLDPSADIFALGTVMRELLTGSSNEDENQPGIGETSKLLAVKIIKGLGKYNLTDAIIGADIPFELRNIIKKCLSFKPEDRPQNAAELFCALYDCPITPDEIKKPYEGIIDEIRKKKDEINQKFGFPASAPALIPTPLPSPPIKQGLAPAPLPPPKIKSTVTPITNQPIPIITSSTQPRISPPVERGLAPIINFNPACPPSAADLCKIISLPRNFRILVVDDNLLITNMRKRVLIKVKNFAVDSALNAIDAMSQLQTKDYDFITSDIIMPGMDGLSMLGKIKSNPSIYGTNSLIPIIIIANYMIHLYEATRLGADNYVACSNINSQNLIEHIRDNYYNPWIKQIAEKILTHPLFTDIKFNPLFMNAVFKSEGNADKQNIIDFVANCLKNNISQNI